MEYNSVDDEKQKYYDKLRTSIIADNKLLFKMDNRPMSETCMCWGLEFNDGWLSTFSDYAYALEGINAILYKLFRIRIQSDQVKEKYGTLRWYTSVEIDPCKAICIYEDIVDWLIGKLGRLDFRLKKVIDKPSYVKNEVEEVKLEDLDAEKDYCKRCSNATLEQKDGKWFKTTKLHVMEKVHYAPTKHKLLYKIFSARYKIKNIFRGIFWNPSLKQEAVANFASMLSEKIVKDAEEACYKVCEQCGSQIGTEWSPRCETLGWISYICDECAKNSNSKYYMNGKMYKNGELCSKDSKEAKKEEV